MELNLVYTLDVAVEEAYKYVDKIFSQDPKPYVKLSGLIDEARIIIGHMIDYDIIPENIHILLPFIDIYMSECPYEENSVEKWELEKCLEYIKKYQ